MKYRLYGRDGISDFEHKKLVDWQVIKLKRLQPGEMYKRKKVRKKVKKQFVDPESGEIIKRLSEKSGSQDSAFTTKTDYEYEYNDDKDPLKHNQGFVI